MSIPQMGLGSFRLKGQQVIDSVLSALDIGFRHIDTAQIYGNEADVGKAIADSDVSRDELFVTSKVWHDRLTKQSLIPSLEESLERLQTDYLDLALVHWPSPNDEVPVAETLEALMEARDQGLIRQLGVSNFTIHHMQQAISAVGEENIATNQIEVHPFLQNRQLIGFLKAHNIPVTAYMPLAYGKVNVDETLAGIAKRHDCSAAQVALAWLLANDMIVIPSSTKKEHQQQNFDAQKIQLDEADMQAILPLERGERLANPDFAPQWDD